MIFDLFGLVAAEDALRQYEKQSTMQSVDLLSPGPRKLSFENLSTDEAGVHSCGTLAGVKILAGLRLSSDFLPRRHHHLLRLPPLELSG